ncbi:UDP-glucuronosyltransferase 2C1 microsomal [Fusarium mexicanum]|uniref:UDP-glucuronosyltransferase 2C1 microsomal n=1 Tax=Fusarium mexicanum TaxID=751941 RepID=A0A8H5MRH6_9HYPO|nr:UDP-glucuronosyltransferase 2C1 microsomal [Fusarium mexicanum]
MADSPGFRRRILLLATTGGFTHAAPVLEIGAVLASRGHDVQFATCAGQEDWTANYPFIKTVYTVGPAASEDDLDVHYETMRLWRHEHGFGPMMRSKYFFDNFWTDTYKSLRSLCENDSTRPDFIVADFFADSAARDMLKQFNIQLASVWPQMPYAMAPVSYHPGQPGFQADGALTSEHASLSSRFWNEFVVLAALPTIIPWLIWTKRMRVDAGVNYSHSLLSKPDYLVLVNSFWGLEAPKELPPLMAPVGPILSDEYLPLDQDLARFLSSHDRTIYVCLGTHVNLPGEELEKYLLGFIQALDEDSINGVIWSIPQKPRANFDILKSYSLSDGSSISITDLLNDSHPHFRLPIFAPQRAILAHPNTVLFLTHGGGSSANETLFHGTSVLAIGYFFDQLCNSARLKAAGVGMSLDKSYLTPSSISSAIADIINDEDGSFAMNVRRMQGIAALNSKRKHLAADLIEEVMIDQELRLKKGVELRPMHLQTADMQTTSHNTNSPQSQCQEPMVLYEHACGNSPAPLRSIAATPRAFGTSPSLLKKRKITAPSNSPNSANAKAAAGSMNKAEFDTAKVPMPDPEDPLDFTAVIAAYAPIDAHFKTQLASMIHGGRFNPTNLGSLPVPMKDHEGNDVTFPLRELAQVVPRSGRAISLLVNDKEYIKPIMSAVQASREFNQQPQRSEDNELELLLKVELERKDDVERRIKETVQHWKDRIRNARSRHEKTLKDWKKSGTVLPDIVKKAEKELQKVQDKKMKEIDQEEAQTIRQL